MSDVAMIPISSPFDATISPPGSKSLTNRALVLAALAADRTTLSNVLFADDTKVMLDGLTKLGFELAVDEGTATVSVAGRAGRIPSEGAFLFCGNSGTTIRFLTALCALGRGDFALDGIERMRQRPIGELVDLLRHVGVRARYLENEGYPPVEVNAHGLPGGLLEYGTAKSSQFLSALLMISPYARHEVRVSLTQKQTSWPYVTMTLQLMDSFGLTAELIRDPLTGEPKEIIIPQGHYSGHRYKVEPDASNATYFLAAAAVHPGARVTINGLGSESLQGDVGFADVLRKMGARVTMDRDSISVTGGEYLRGVSVDLSSMPDTAQTLAVVALFAEGRTTIHGLETLRVKETDRLSALSTELSRLGAEVKIEGDTLQIDSPLKIKPAEIATYDDHRMAMSFAIAGTRAAGIVIRDSECVNKTYPGYFSDLKKVLEQKS